MKFFILLLVSFSVEAACFKNFRQAQKKVLHALSRAEVEKISELAASEKPVQGWKLLSELNDPYAALAYKVISKSKDPADLYYQILIERHWKNSAGEAAFKKNFQSVAIQHFKQYAAIIAKGYWPDSDQILNSYLKAIRDHEMPDETVFDAAWDASGMNATRTWQSLNHLDESRSVIPTNACYTIDPQHALKLVMKDLSGL